MLSDLPAFMAEGSGNTNMESQIPEYQPCLEINGLCISDTVTQKSISAADFGSRMTYNLPLSLFPPLFTALSVLRSLCEGVLAGEIPISFQGILSFLATVM